MELKVGDYVISKGDSSRLLQVYSIRNGLYFAKTLTGKMAMGTTMNHLVKVDITKLSDLEKLIYGIR